MRKAARLLSFPVALLLVSGLAAQNTSGYVASGAVTLTEPGGHAEAGTIHLDIGGPRLCKLTLTLGSPILRRSYTAVVNGSGDQITGPAGWFRAVPLPISPKTGCLLLLAAPASGAAAVALHGQSATLAYRGAITAAAITLPGTITESISGTTRLTIRFTAIAAGDFTAGTFVLPGPPVPKVPPQAGGAQ